MIPEIAVNMALKGGFIDAVLSTILYSDALQVTYMCGLSENS